MSNEKATGESMLNPVEEFKKVRLVYEVFATVLATVLSHAAKDLGVQAIVQTRAKEIPSFAEKCIRKKGKYPFPVLQLTDLCGARVITECKDEIDTLCKFIEKHFEIDKANSEDVLERLGVGEFGYRSVHYIVSLKPGEFADILDPMVEKRGAEFKAQLDQLYERRTEAMCAATKLPPGPLYRAEIQVRTLLQHAWAQLGHDRIYKADFEVPRRWKRDMNRIAATLEEADDAFDRTMRGVESYQNYFGAYMSPKRRKEEVDTLESVFVYDSKNLRLAHNIARLAISLEMWELATTRLGAFVLPWENSPEGKALTAAAKTAREGRDADALEQAGKELERLRDPRFAAVLLDYGWAIWKRKDPEGRKYLEWAMALAPGLADTQVVLGDTYVEEGDFDTALEYYEQAFKTAPSDPRTLERYLHCKVASEKNVDFVSLIRHSLETAIALCHERAKAGVYLPQAYYDIGLFALLLDRPYESLSAYACAVRLSEGEGRVGTALYWMGRLQRALKSKLPHLEWVCRFLRLAQVGKQWQAVNAAQDELAIDPGKPEAEAKAAAALNRLEVLRTELARDFASNKALPSGIPFAMVAGGCDERIQARMEEYSLLLKTAFKGYEGCIFSGGTTSGISGLVGDLPTSQTGRPVKISYLPNAIPHWTSVHSGYTIHRTKNERFSVLEPIQNWIDLLCAGVNPADVRLVGINGGDIAGFEYRLGLVLGAKVGILRESGRAADALLQDEDWSNIPELITLPNDPQTLREFVRKVPPAAVIDPEIREALARQAHEEYLKGPRKQQIQKDPSLECWDKLHPNLKRSNYAQIDHIEEKMRASGLTLLKKAPETVVLREFSDDEVKSLAEMEHGRWNAERLLAGWTFGEKDVEKKHSPCLIPWAELSEEVKDFDRNAVRQLPEMLKGLGYEITQGTPD